MRRPNLKEGTLGWHVIWTCLDLSFLILSMARWDVVPRVWPMRVVITLFFFYRTVHHARRALRELRG